MNVPRFQLCSPEGPARCINGSPSGYYFDQGSSNNTVIFLQGGGACWTADASLFSCWLRYNTSLGSSTGWAATMAYDTNWMNRDCSLNPIACTWNLVYVPYCSGDVHIGTRTAIVNESLPFYFSGHNTIAAVVEDLVARTGIATAEDVIFTGSSAGGFGTFLNADYVSGKLLAAGARRVRAAPQAGWFFPHVVKWAPWLAGQTGPPYALDTADIFTVYDAYLHPACAAAGHNASFCTSVTNLYPFLTTPLYVAENQADSNQIFMELGCPLVNNATVNAYIAYFQGAMKEAIQQVYAKNGGADGLYFPSCLVHTADTTLQSNTTIGGVSYLASLQTWYDGTDGAELHIADSCGVAGCNPTCPA